ncbi:MAG: (2Fe-2S)-binding protein [Acidimicrobiia bacterium]|nr:(2Fe-2S)-binding protein [Actinomycetota bacterium]MBL6923931.1 (2Fe-2S)-binding protein [Acidimicrobiia bacterium]MBL6926066.1 (2Fe-2S)-binding protein [Acidimicrobiia bacterium]
MSPRRIPSRPGELIDRSTTVSFTWNGRAFTGHQGDTIASALAAAGVEIFSRSMKYHRRRGIFSANHWDPNLSVQVGDEPNVRAGSRRLLEGMQVSAQNVWPSLRFDLGTANQLVGRFLSAGFYYKTFMRPQFLWHSLYQRILRKFAPGGRIHWNTSTHGAYDKRYAHPDVLIAGGGPAGMAAALSAAEAGATVMLVEQEPELGGHLRWGANDDLEVLADLRSAVEASPGIEVLVDSTVSGRYDHNWIAINQRSHPLAPERLIKARAGSLVVAPGLIERPYVFAGNDTPGVMLAGAVRRLTNLWAVRPGDRAVVLTASSEGDSAVADLESAGVEIVEVLDARSGADIVKVDGRGRVRKVHLGDGRTLAADLVVTATGWTAPTSLLNMAGDRPVYDPVAARYFPHALPDNVLATGGITGDGSIAELLAHGRETGELAAARALRIRHDVLTTTARSTSPKGPRPETVPDDRIPLRRVPHPECYRSSTHGLVDFSEDISSKDLMQAASEGFDSIELMKRYTTVTMGPSQGKLETVNAASVLAEARQVDMADVGTTVWRPPFSPISLGALAGRIFEPVRRSALQDWHEANGAVNLLAGQWVRPDRYGDPMAEALNVRNNVGLIDVTPLGKLDLRGPDVPKLLELVYVNRWQKLKVGRVRYGAMVGEDGVVSDDGVTGRLAKDHYLMTTTSSGAGAVWEMLEDWLQTYRSDWEVHVTPVTGGLTSINVAGPRSRDLLERLVGGVDLSADAFPYFSVRTGTVAGVADCIIWRIGFTGELSYELHVPSGHALHVWESLLATGSDLGAAPFGVEAQRILRLEKGHYIVGQDTDGLSKAPTAGLAGLVKLDKEDTVGLPELRAAFDRTDLPVLVGLQPDDPTVVPEEACQIVAGDSNEILGRVTSSRMSPTLGRSICLAQVDPKLAAAGTSVTVKLVDGSRITATVQEHHAHLDPEGERQRV